MTREDIIRMAREAGLGDTGVRGGFIFFQPGTDGLERFADLVAAAERKAWEPVQDSEWEVRADGKRVRRDRWQIGIRRIAALLWGNRQEFEVDEVVEAVRHLVPNPCAEGDDEALVKAVLDAAIRARGNT